MTIALEKKWIWDSWYHKEGDVWHGYFLQADKSLIDPELRHLNVSQAHAISKDLIHWEHLGTCFEPSTTTAWDDSTTWTGSVVKDDDGLYHLFYTGTCLAEKSLYQRVGHAISDDLHNWKRVGDGLCLDIIGENAQYYEDQHQVGHWHDRAMRDPWVMKNPNGKGWLMYFTARAPDIEEPNAGGAIGFATSDDLYHWELQKPVFVGGFGQLEVPQVFELEGRWYCLFCTSSSHWADAFIKARAGKPVTGNHYLVADNPEGPWSLPESEFLDGDEPCYRYAARILQTDTGPVIIGFHDQGPNGFVGEILDPVAVHVNDEGLLSTDDNNKKGQ
ncbi:levansucrase [Marinomonas sp. UCMA 3892]|uniref:levansucrase n=1 Tax=unclassified Marinomonas TaxID=196814 RepID=UPI00146F58B1|nr:levansucrase [Marinomonas sp. UCMA 3892]NLU97598.1 levansucrase [Marinomonas sp. UCMA 3892]